MRLLDRYLLRELLIMLAFCLGGFLIIWDAFSLFGELNQYQERHLSVADVLELYAVRIPGTLVLVVPIVLLLSLLYALTNHTRHNEITAIRAAGISLWRLCLTYFAVAFVLSLALFYLNEVWAPDAAAREISIKARHIVHEDPAEIKEFGFIGDNRRWTCRLYNFHTHVLTDPRVYWNTSSNTEVYITGTHAEFINGVWTFFDARASEGLNAPVVTNVMPMPEFSETPDEINRQFQDDIRIDRRDTSVSIKAVLDYLKSHRQHLSPREHWWLSTQLHSRFAAPWTCIVVVLIAIPFGAASGRRNLFAGVAGSIGICFLYFILMKLGLALGTGGWTPGWVAAWLPNIAFSLAGIWLMLRVR